MPSKRAAQVRNLAWSLFINETISILLNAQENGLAVTYLEAGGEAVVHGEGVYATSGLEGA